MTPPPPNRYSLPAVLLHWLMALGLLGAIAAGWYASELPMGLQRLKLINWHKWAGIGLLLLWVLRLAWRWVKRPPPALPMPAWQARASSAVHGLLYLLMGVVPLLGWSYSNAAGFPVVWLGVVPLPDFLGPDKALAETLKELHGIAAWTLATLIALHVAAALKHHFLDRDRLLARMGFGKDSV
jgi:cytochrome b561